MFSEVQASVVVGGTRLIYDGSRKEASLNLSNPDKGPYLVQSWIETAAGSTEAVPFIATPPLFRLDAGQSNVLRVVKITGEQPADRESLYWMNIKAIPAIDQDSSKNTLQIAVKTRIKLIYRPQNLKGVPEGSTDELVWTRSGRELHVQNPTPFYMNFHEVRVNGIDVGEVTYVAPMCSANFTLPASAKGGRVTWKIISDYGSIGSEHKQVL